MSIYNLIFYRFNLFKSDSISSFTSDDSYMSKIIWIFGHSLHSLNISRHSFSVERVRIKYVK